MIQYHLHSTDSPAFYIKKTRLEVQRSNADHGGGDDNVNDFSKLTLWGFIKFVASLHRRRSLEVQSQLSSTLPSSLLHCSRGVTMARRSVHLPVNWDWRRYGVLDGEPPNQRLGTCWAHAAAATVEGNLQVQSIFNVGPSTQELIDCCLVDGGTDGGDAMSAFEYMMQLGITSNNVYPLNPPTDEARGVCKRCDDGGHYRPNVKIRNIQRIFDISEHNLKAAVKERPLLVNTHCGGPLYDLYGRRGGILSSGFFSRADPKNGIENHSMVLIGYGTERGIPYWLLRNSYGPRWGVDGCVKIHRSLTHTFGLVAYPVGAYLI